MAIYSRGGDSRCCPTRNNGSFCRRSSDSRWPIQEDSRSILCGSYNWREILARPMKNNMNCIREDFRKMSTIPLL